MVESFNYYYGINNDNGAADMRTTNKTSAYIDGYNAFCDRLAKRDEETNWSQYATEAEADDWFAGYADAKEDNRPH